MVLSINTDVTACSVIAELLLLWTKPDRDNSMVGRKPSLRKESTTHTLVVTPLQVNTVGAYKENTNISDRNPASLLRSAPMNTVRISINS